MTRKQPGELLVAQECCPFRSPAVLTPHGGRRKQEHISDDQIYSTHSFPCLGFHSLIIFSNKNIQPGIEGRIRTNPGKKLEIRNGIVQAGGTNPLYLELENCSTAKKFLGETGLI